MCTQVDKEELNEIKQYMTHFNQFSGGKLISGLQFGFLLTCILILNVKPQCIQITRVKPSDVCLITQRLN